MPTPMVLVLMVVGTIRGAQTAVTAMVHAVSLAHVSAFVIGAHLTALKGYAPSVLR